MPLGKAHCESVFIYGAHCLQLERMSLKHGSKVTQVRFPLTPVQFCYSFEIQLDSSVFVFFSLHILVFLFPILVVFTYLFFKYVKYHHAFGGQNNTREVDVFPTLCPVFPAHISFLLHFTCLLPATNLPNFWFYILLYK